MSVKAAVFEKTETPISLFRILNFPICLLVLQWRKDKGGFLTHSQTVVAFTAVNPFQNVKDGKEARKEDGSGDGEVHIHLLRGERDWT